MEIDNEETHHESNEDSQEEKEDVKQKPMKEKEELNVETATIADCRKAIAAVINECCPTLIRFKRTSGTPSVTAALKKCRARLVGLRWDKGQAQLMCEYPIGSGEVMTHSTFAYECLLVYAEANGTYDPDDETSKKPKHPNAWRELIVPKILADIESSAPRDEDGDEWITIETMLPSNLRPAPHSDTTINVHDVNSWLHAHRKRSSGEGRHGLPVKWTPDALDEPPALSGSVYVVTSPRVATSKERPPPKSKSTSCSATSNVEPRRGNLGEATRGSIRKCATHWEPKAKSEVSLSKKVPVPTTKKITFLSPIHDDETDSDADDPTPKKKTKVIKEDKDKKKESESQPLSESALQCGALREKVEMWDAVLAIVKFGDAIPINTKITMLRALLVPLHHSVPRSGTPLGDPPQRGLKEGESAPPHTTSLRQDPQRGLEEKRNESLRCTTKWTPGGEADSERGREHHATKWTPGGEVEPKGSESPHFSMPPSPSHSHFDPPFTMASSSSTMATTAPPFTTASSSSSTMATTAPPSTTASSSHFTPPFTMASSSSSSTMATTAPPFTTASSSSSTMATTAPPYTMASSSSTMATTTPSTVVSSSSTMATTSSNLVPYEMTQGDIDSLLANYETLPPSEHYPSDDREAYAEGTMDIDLEEKNNLVDAAVEALTAVEEQDLQSTTEGEATQQCGDEYALQSRTDGEEEEETTTKKKKKITPFIRDTVAATTKSKRRRKQ